MRTAVYYNNRDVRLEERPRPKIGAGEMLVKIHASGICGSDVLEWYRIKKAPIVLGHEIAGEIVETGEGVERYAAGQRVFVSHHVPCNTCRHCLQGNHTCCHTLHTTNFDPGGFAEYVRIPRINVDRGVFVLPDSLSYDHGVFIEPLACVLRGQRATGLQAGQSLLILGSGVSGLLHLLCAKALGVGRVLMTDVSPYRLEMAKRLGADVAIDARDNVAERVRAANEGRGADQVYVCTGALSAFDQAMDAVEPGGVILAFATTPPDVKIQVPINQFWRNSVTIMSSYANSPHDAALAMELMRAGRVDPLPTITHRFPLAQAAEGFRLMADAGDSMKIIIEPLR